MNRGPAKNRQTQSESGVSGEVDKIKAVGEVRFLELEKFYDDINVPLVPLLCRYFCGVDNRPFTEKDIYYRVKNGMISESLITSIVMDPALYMQVAESDPMKFNKSDDITAKAIGTEKPLYEQYLDYAREKAAKKKLLDQGVVSQVKTDTGEAVSTRTTFEKCPSHDSSCEDSATSDRVKFITENYLNGSDCEKSPNEDSIREIMGAMTELLIEKNRRYGDSAITPKKIFSKLSGEAGILIRLDDKISRVMNSDEVRLNDVCDLIGYEVLLLIARNTNRQDILKLID